MHEMFLSGAGRLAHRRSLSSLSKQEVEALDPRTASNMATELSALVKAANIAPPYIVVALFYGGIIYESF